MTTDALPRPCRLWADLEADSKLLAARALFDDPEAVPVLNVELASALGAPLDHIEKMPTDFKVVDLVRHVTPDEEIAVALLTALHLRHRSKMLCAFLDDLSIKHHEGSIVDDEDLEIPAAPAVRDAVARLYESFPEEHVSLYLELEASVDPEFWTALIVVLSERELHKEGARQKSQRIFDRLFPEVGQEGFLRDYWQTKPLWTHGASERVTELASLCERIVDAESLIDATRGRSTDTVMVYREAVSTNATPAQGLTWLHDGGCTLQVRLEQKLPEVQQIRQELAAAFDIPADRFQGQAFASPGGIGNARGLHAHLDPHEVFIFQLCGSKRWRIRRANQRAVSGYNPAFVKPGAGGADVFGRHPEGPPQAPTTDFTEVVLEPGSILYLPHSYWHGTTAEEGLSISISLHTVLPPWPQVFATWLEDELLHHDFFRRPILLQSAETERDLLSRALEVVRGRSADDIARFMRAHIERPEKLFPGPGPYYRRNPNARLELRGSDDAAGDQLVVTTDSSEPTTIDLNETMRAVLGWLASTSHDVFSHSEVATATSHDAAHVYLSLAALVGAGLLLARSGPSPI